MKIAVIVITYNAMPWVGKCFKPLVTDDRDKKVYVVDNGSSDGTQNFIASHFPEFSFFQSESNLGFGKANNLALKMALTDGCTHFLLLNQDAYITWENIIELTAIQIEHSEFGILSPIQLHSDSVVDRLHLKSLMANNIDYFNDLIAENPKKPVYEIGYTNAAIWLISKDCLRKAGGFDPLFPHYGEDTEYAQRVNYLGFRVGLCPKIIAYHYRSQQIERRRNEAHYFNTFLIQLKEMQQELWKVYLRIFLQLIVSPMRRNAESQTLQSKESWRAFWKIFKKFHTISEHRIQCLHNEYKFIDFHN